MTSSHNTNGNCYSAILRRLLCSGSLPTHPSEQITEPPNTTNFNDHNPKKDSKLELEAKLENSAKTPGLLARLMGLETLPDMNWVPKSRISDTFARSRSVNSMDYFIDFSPQQAQHRRATTSLSFREVPSFSHQKSHEFFVLYLQNVDENETKKLGWKQSKKTEVGFEEMKQKKAERQKINKEKRKQRVNLKKKNNGESSKKAFKGNGDGEKRELHSENCSKLTDCNGAKKSSSVLRHKNDINRQGRAISEVKSSTKLINDKAEMVRFKFKEEKKCRQPVKKTGLKYCGSKNANPVTFLDPQDLSIKHQSPLSDKSSPKIQLGAAENKLDNRSLKNTGETEYCAQLLGEICRLAEADIKESYWMAKVYKFEDIEDILVDLGQQIFDQLLHQVIFEVGGN